MKTISERKSNQSNIYIQSINIYPSIHFLSTGYPALRVCGADKQPSKLTFTPVDNL